MSRVKQMQQRTDDLGEPIPSLCSDAFLTCQSLPNEAGEVGSKRIGRVVAEFRGPDAVDKAQAFHEWIIRRALASRAGGHWPDQQADAGRAALSQAETPA